MGSEMIILVTRGNVPCLGKKLFRWICTRQSLAYITVSSDGGSGFLLPEGNVYLTLSPKYILRYIFDLCALKGQIAKQNLL